MHDYWIYSIWTLSIFILGSISVGDLVSRLAGVNIRTVGTGNPGAANIYREIGKPYGISVVLLDVVKGAIATLPLYFLEFPLPMLAISTAAVIVGHLFPIFWKFNGGTGMATAMGCSMGLLPMGGLIAIPVATLTIFFSKNTGYTGGVFFLTVVLVGSVFHNDVFIPVATVIVVAATILIKSKIQYQDE